MSTPAGEKLSGCGTEPQPNSTSTPQDPAQSGISSDQVPHNNKADKDVEVLAPVDFNRSNPEDRIVDAAGSGCPSKTGGELADQEEQERKERLEKKRREIYETRKVYALDKNLAAFEKIQGRYKLPSGQPILKILKNGKEVEREIEDGEMTGYDTDEDDGADNDKDADTQRYNDFVQAVGCCNEPLDPSENKILLAYLNSYLHSRWEYARARRFNMGTVRSSMAEKILLSIKNQRRVPETWTWSNRKWNREMNEAILHHKKTDSFWKGRMAVLDERLAKSWQENVEGARRDLQVKR
ncbi:hypothetical protein BGZ96_008772 [Linnemannia gamsii]|uniref:Uncharacterized protein n=1 Tax=Linnemannia gamsii TaxID=64522 RepID=A0ABQ7JYN0_9FUNG|nr:hypothetical protein BGZ96_008772 [Linnemannia gamsii]